MKKNLSNVVLVLVFFVGLSVLLYPTISNYWNMRTQSRAIVNYEAAITKMNSEDFAEIFSEADDYNRQLRKIAYPFMNNDRIEGYDDLLNITEDGVIGYINIDKIDVELPIYHGTSNDILNVAVGHLEGSSLPVGGENTHAVLSAHRGLPRAKLFTNLDKLVEGDTFTISVLNKVLTYQVDQILIVEPEIVEPLDIVEGKDYCTLLTCTPYGINTHRLLVRGTRVDTIDTREIYVAPDAYQIEPLVIMPIVATPILLALLVALLVKYRKKEK